MKNTYVPLRSILYGLTLLCFLTLSNALWAGNAPGMPAPQPQPALRTQAALNHPISAQTLQPQAIPAAASFAEPAAPATPSRSVSAPVKRPVKAFGRGLLSRLPAIEFPRFWRFEHKSAASTSDISNSTLIVIVVVVALVLVLLLVLDAGWVIVTILLVALLVLGILVLLRLLA